MLEKILLQLKESRRLGTPGLVKLEKGAPADMVNYGVHAANFIMNLGVKLGAQVLVETRIHLGFIHPEMFGTFDGAVIDHFGTLHVFDYKYGAGHAVSPKENLQMIFYGLGLAHHYHWNFKRVRLWIIQPRIRGYDGPTFWEVGIEELRKYVKIFEAGVKAVEQSPDKFAEGPHCWWCRAKKKCPLKQNKKLEQAQAIFAPVQKGNAHGKKESKKEKGHQEESTEESFI